jgi:hypothetical protein
METAPDLEAIRRRGILSRTNRGARSACRRQGYRGGTWQVGAIPFFSK